MLRTTALGLLFSAFVFAASAAALPPPPPRFVPANFVKRVDNPWFPLKPATVYVYRGMRDGKQSRDVVAVKRWTRTIVGIHATVVQDKLFLGGRLAERTTDWYAQDRRGNVWYLGEATAELDKRGRITSREGSWLTGRDGAQPGIYMPPHPVPGSSGRQEFYRGHAEDHFRVLTLGASVTTPYVSSHDALLTREWTPLEPGVIDHKLYVRGVGTVREETVKGGNELAILVSVRHV
jgi:hypothetical protein